MGLGSEEALASVPEGEYHKVKILTSTNCQVLLELWTSAGDSVRIAAFLAVRKTFVAGDESLKDICLKVCRTCCDLIVLMVEHLQIPPRPPPSHFCPHPPFDQPDEEHRCGAFRARPRSKLPPRFRFHPYPRYPPAYCGAIDHLGTIHCGPG